MQAAIKRRGLADVIGFAHLERQMDVLMERIHTQDAATLERLLRQKDVSADERWRMAIAPHDDYAYAGFMYSKVNSGLASGFLFSNTINPTAGLRFRF